MGQLCSNLDDSCKMVVGGGRLCLLCNMNTSIDSQHLTLCVVGAVRCCVRHAVRGVSWLFVLQ